MAEPSPNRLGPWTHDYAAAYASEHVALAVVEILGHWSAFADLNRYSIFAVNLEEGGVETALETDSGLDIGDKVGTQRHGDEWTRRGLRWIVR